LHKILQLPFMLIKPMYLSAELKKVVLLFPLNQIRNETISNNKRFKFIVHFNPNYNFFDLKAIQATGYGGSKNRFGTNR